MTDDVLKAAEQCLAEGDYVQALAELGKVSVPDPEVGRMVRAALDQIKNIGAHEFVAGRWTVAEGIFDAVEEHARLLLPAEREQCRNLVAAIQGRRESSKNAHAVLQAAAQMAAEARYPEARELALQVMRDCRDPALVGRLRRLLRGLPHPTGQLIYGFDSELEAENFTRSSEGARIEVWIEENHPMAGGFARIELDARGRSLTLVDLPLDWTDFKELSFWFRAGRGVKGHLRVLVGEAECGWSGEIKLWEHFWNQARLVLSTLSRRGSPRWDSVRQLAFVLDSEGPVAFDIDEVRLK